MTRATICIEQRCDIDGRNHFVGHIMLLRKGPRWHQNSTSVSFFVEDRSVISLNFINQINEIYTQWRPSVSVIRLRHKRMRQNRANDTRDNVIARFTEMRFAHSPEFINRTDSVARPSRLS